MRRTAITPVQVEFMPESLDEGVLYISTRFQTALHLCCCGCRGEVVTPLSAAEWRLTETREGVSLYPSIGNWSMPCRAHYWIELNRVVWERPMSEKEIARVRERDRRDIARQIAEVNAAKSTETAVVPPPVIRDAPASLWRRAVNFVKRAFAR